MRKVFFIIPLFLIAVILCERTEKKDIQDWLQQKIERIKDDDFYYGSKIYWHSWKPDYYHLEISVSSCMFCELYDVNGENVVFDSNEEFEDYMQNRKDETVLWR